MRYDVELKPRARKDLQRIGKPEVARILASLDELKNDLHGDVKWLTNFTPEYRLRIGDYRALFEIEQPNRIVVYRIRHRRDVLSQVRKEKMVVIHPNILEHDGQKAFVVLSYEEFLMVEEELQQFEDLKQLREAKAEEADSPTVPLDVVRKELGL